MKNNLFIIYIAMLFPLLLQAQTGSIWRMGDNLGNQKEFNFNPPNPLYSQNCSNGCLTKSCSTMDDGNGNIILHSNGYAVFDANWNIILNGNAIGWANNAPHGCLILPHPGNSNQYFIFTSDNSTIPQNDSLSIGLRYAIADMSLNGGLGQVISKNNILADSAFEKMTCTRHCNGIDWWIVVHKWGTNAYYSFKVSALGVDTVPVISHAGMVLSDTLNGYSANRIRRIGSMRISPNSKFFAHTIAGSGPNSVGRNLQLFTFNNQTGSVNPRVFLDSIGNGVGITFCFSPNSRKLYRQDSGNLGTQWGKNLVVYDLNSTDSAQIAASETGLLPNTNNYSFVNGIQVGVDGKLYCITYDNTQFYISIFDNPDADTANIVMHLNQIPLGANSAFLNFTQFPDCIFARKHQGILRTRKCSYGLENETIILDTLLNVVHEFTWDFGDPASGVNNSSTERNPYHEFTAPGAYTITLTLHNACNQFTVTQQFIYNFVTVNAGSDLTLCQGDTAFLNVTATGGANNYIWQPSALLNDSSISNPYSTSNTLFIASQIPSGCADSVQVVVNQVNTPSIGVQGFNLSATTALNYQWYVNGVAILGATLQEHFPSQIGNYTVVTTDINGCTSESVPYNVAVVGLNNQIYTRSTIYPNPANELLFINSNINFMHYIIYNIFGSEIMKNSYNIKIEIKHLPPGVYCIKLFGENKIEKYIWLKE